MATSPTAAVNVGTASVRRASHPPGLYVLFFTELWERYSFYSMVSILVLYMNESLGFDSARAGSVYGWYTAGVYFLPLFGGLLADRWLGFSRSVLIGGTLMMIGHLVLGIEQMPAFYSGLLLLACGSGLLKPNISTMVGNLYRDRPELRDQAFNIFYMGINIGSFMAPIGVSWVRARYGWGPAFMSAAIAMFISLVIFATFRHHVAAAAVRVDQSPTEGLDHAASDIRARLTTLLIVLVISTVFWSAWYQEFFTFTLFARDNTATTIPPERFSSFEALGVIFLSPAAAWLWAVLNRQRREPSTPTKMLLGIAFLALAFGLLAYAAVTGGNTARVSVAWLISANMLLAVGEVALSPMGMSLVNRLAPPRLRGLMMGAWFASLALGGKLSGFIGGYWDTIPHSRFFGGIALALVAAALPLSLMTPYIKRTIRNAEAAESSVAH
jgi:proton-dependent oligopeptide transporter, POT family